MWCWKRAISMPTPSRPIGLPLRLPVFPQECAADYLVRLYQMNGRPWQNFSSDFGLSPKALHSRQDAIEVLAALVPDQAEQVGRLTPDARPLHRHIEVAGEMLHESMWTTHGRRWCPQCWNEDIASSKLPVAAWSAHGRFWWNMTLISTCPTHCKRLVSACPQCDGKATWKGRGLLSCSSGHDLIPGDAGAVTESDTFCDRYILGRLGALPAIQIPLLDGADLATAIHTMGHLGAAKVLGPTEHWRRPDKMAEILSAGCRIAMDWPHAFEDLVTKLAKADRSYHRSGATALGALYDWICHLPEAALGESLMSVMFPILRRSGIWIERQFAAR